MTGARVLDEAALAGLGARLRELRRAKGWSLGELSAASGVSTATISKIENLVMSPSLVHAINLATALGENLGFLVDRDGQRFAEFSVSRSGQRAQLDLPEMSLTLQDLHGDFEQGVLEARMGLIAPGARSGEEPMTHPGEEVCHLLEGAIRFDIGGEVFDLAPGDTIHFHCDVPHSWENTAKRPTRVLWVFSDGLSF